MYDFAVIGGGIVGLSTAMALGERYPDSRLLVLEKESDWAYHQSGHNSGVIHSGIYYKPGSFKASFTRKGSRSIVEFCERHRISYEVCGKIIVATEPRELPLLEALYLRGVENGLKVQRIGPERVKEIEPYVNCISAIHVPTTGIADYRQVCLKYVDLIRTKGGSLQLGTRVEKIAQIRSNHIIETNKGTFESRFLINCAGLFSDRVAKLNHTDPEAKIIPFRGEYYEIKAERRYLVRNLIYPVPDPEFPFLGVHFTRMIDGSVHAGPNAVLSLKREGYKKTDFSFRDLCDVLTYPGFWRLAQRHSRAGIQEMVRSISKAAFVRSLRRLIPEISGDDLVPAHAGIRAQAIRPNGQLVDDFMILTTDNAVHVCNAPSPAATSSIEIGKAIVGQIHRG
jgi:L-2-hydroxyglutarate oxidase